MPKPTEHYQDTVSKIDKALQMVYDLCKPEGMEGKRRWVMSIPAEPDYDPDIVIADALYEARRLLLALVHAPEPGPSRFWKEQDTSLDL